MKNDRFDEEPKGQDLYDHWQALIDETFTFVKDKYWNKWRKWLRLERGEHWLDYAAEDRDMFASDNPPVKITANLLGPYSRQMTAYMVSRDAYISTEAENTESAENGILLEAAVNKEWRRCHTKDILKMANYTGNVIGWSAVESGYTFEVDESVNVQDDGYLEFRDFVKLDETFDRLIWQFNFVYDLNASEKNLETARWCCERFYQSPSYVLNNERYNPSVRRAIRSGEERPEVINPQEEDNLPSSMKKLWCLYKLWDKQFRRFYIFCKGVKKPLVEKDWPYPYIQEFPIKMYNYIKHPNEWFGSSMYEDVEDMQYELNRFLTAAAHYRRLNVGGQSQVAELDPAQKTLFNRGGRLIETGEHEIKPISTPPFPQDQYIIIGHYMNMMERIIGLSNITQGAESSGRRAATEIRARTQFTMNRLDGIADDWNRFVDQLAYDKIAHIQENYDVPRMQALKGALGSYWRQLKNLPLAADGTYYVTYNKADLAGDFQIKVESTVKPKQDPAMEFQTRVGLTQQLLQLAGIAGQMGKPMDLQPVEIARWLFDSAGQGNALPRLVTSAAVIPPPIQTQQGQPPQAQPPAMPPQQQQMMQQAATPESGMMGGMMGGGTNNA